MISFERLKEILERFSKVKIAVVGDMMLDEYLIGKVSRISPEAPVPVVNIEEERFVLGGASNVANNLKSLSAQVSVYGVVGKDSNGEKFVKELESKYIDPSGIVIDETRPTIIKSRVLSQGQQLLRLDWEKDTDITENIQKKIIENVEKNIENTDALLLSDYNKGVLTEFVSQSIIKIAKKYNREVVVDPKPNNFLTRSEEGVSLFKNEPRRIPTVAREVYDVTGAGDTFISTFLLSVCAGADLFEAGAIANMASGIVVAKIGTATATKEEILEFYHNVIENNYEKI